MTVYGRIEKVSETMQSNQRENELFRSDDPNLGKEEQVTVPAVKLIIGSTIATIFSVVLPFLLDMLTSSQAQDFYIGWALYQGGQFQSNYYASQGFLYYIFLYITQGSILFAIVEWLALLVSGYFLYRSTDYLTGQNKQADQLLTIFYLLVSGLGFGGGYANILALPFLLGGFLLIANYLSNPNHDKGFLRLGILFGISFFIEPLTTFLFILVVTIGLLIFNIDKERFINGVYQFFASALGFSLIFYPLAYYVLVSGGAEEALSGIMYPIASIRIFANPQLLENALFYGLIALGLGGFLFIFLILTQSRISRLYALSIPASFGFLLSLVLTILSQEPFHGSRLLVSLPFLLLLLIANIQGKHSGRGSRRREETPSLGERFMKGNLYLPVLVIAYLLVFPFVDRFLLHPDTFRQESQVVEIIKRETSEKDQIYIWDQFVRGYKDSHRLAGSMFPSPVLYTTTAENKNVLINDLKENQPKMIVVNNKVSLWSEVADLLKEHYQVKKTDLTNFKVYTLK